MDKLHCEKLLSYRSYLEENISDVDTIVSVLFEKGILTVSLKQDIMQGEKTTVRQIRKLLDILPTLGPSAFNQFCNALIQNRQTFIVEQLKKPLAISVPEIQNSIQQQPSRYHQHPFYAGSNQESIVAQPEEIIPDFQFPADWAGSLNMPPVNSKGFDVDSCTHEDVARIKRQNIYRMGNIPHGQALIINNQEFSEGGAHFAKRMRSETDSNRLQQVLKSLSFQVQIQTDLNYEKMEAMLQRFSKIEHKDDAFILIILSYGGDGTVYCADGKEMKIQDIVNTYSTNKCGTLIGKPKLIFIQACGVILADGKTRQPQDTQIDHAAEIIKGLKGLSLGTQRGDETDTNHLPDNVAVLPVDTSDSLVAMATGPDGQTRQPQETQIDHAAEIIKGLKGLSLGTQRGDETDTNHLPDIVAVLPVDTSDSLVAMATGPDIKHANYGSVFILALSYVFLFCSKNQDLDTMLKMINQLQKDEKNGGFIKLCEVRSSLKQKLYFLPGFPLKGNEADIDFPVHIPQPVPFVGSTPKA